MDAQSYLHWLRTTDLEVVRTGDLLEAVTEVLKGLDEECEQEPQEAALEMSRALQAIRAVLLTGDQPLDLIREFRIEFDVDPSTYEPPEAVLEQELREIAAGIARDRWCTETFERFEATVSDFLDGGEEGALWQVVDEVETLLEESYQAYSQTTILPREVTMESTVVHKLLCEGLGWWKEVVESIREDEDPDWSGLVEMAETGNRLLMAVQIFNQRVQRALS